MTAAKDGSESADAPKSDRVMVPMSMDERIDDVRVNQSMAVQVANRPAAAALCAFRRRQLHPSP
jgi:hypothetical protein